MKRKMDVGERCVDAYLRSVAGFNDVIHEPDGNVPPDFLADGRIAVEARRLNNLVDEGNGLRGIEESAIPIEKAVERIAASFGPPGGEGAWFYVLRVRRSAADFKKLRSEVSEVFDKFKDAPTVPCERVMILNSVQLHFIPNPQPTDRMFESGFRTDQRATVFVDYALRQNIEICIREKSDKIKNFKAKYSEWWLALVDRITFGMRPTNHSFFDELRKVESQFDRLVVIDPSDPQSFYEI